MESLSRVPDRHYFETNKPVTGGNRADRTDMVNKVETFLRTGGLGHIENRGDDFILPAKDAKHLTGLRGTQKTARIDIQGPEGPKAVRIAYQKGTTVNAQVIIPINKVISRNEFIQAFEDSMKSKKVVSFVDPAQANAPDISSRKKKAKSI